MRAKLHDSRFTSDASRRCGFTLIELLVVVSIVGTLTALGTVSYSSVRAQARDVERVSDTKQLQTALDLFYDSHGFYPSDRHPGSDGLILGVGDATVLSDAGFSGSASGAVYLSPVPKNPIPFGADYLYRSLNADGTDCDFDDCPSYAILFALEGPVENVATGPHAMTPNGISAAVGFPAGAYVPPTPTAGADSVQADIDYVAAQTADTVVAVARNPQVTKTTQNVVAPSVAAASAVNVAYASSQFGQYLLFFLTQPFALFGLRRRKSWGTVYDAVTHVPVDLAIVRLHDAVSEKVVQSAVTDGDGRFSFLVRAGSYRLEAAKAGIVFPSAVAASKTEDGPYHDLYHGDAITVGKGGGILTNDIPVDPSGVDAPDDVIIRQSKQKHWHHNVALVSPVLGGMALVIKPSLFVALLFAAELAVYALFRRLAEGKSPKGWGTVYHQATEKPVAQAVVRIFEAKYNKLLEAQVTDFLGRYHFRVGPNRYYLTASKEGFRKTETEPVDLTSVTGPVVVASDLPLAPVSGGLVVAVRRAAPVARKSSLPPPPVSRGFGAPDVAAGRRVVPAVPTSLQDDGKNVEPVSRKIPTSPAAEPPVPESLRDQAVPPATEGRGAEGPKPDAGSEKT
jgi:prepilin-type N-terminal cleavage/methylation domain-containing protein